MARFKEKEKILHRASTHEIFMCLYSMPIYSRILLDNSPGKTYAEFLEWLLEKDFFRENDERTTTKKLATEFKSDSAKITKWLKDIYEDILDLNFEKRSLFQTDGIRVKLYMNSYDNYCIFFTSMPTVPREYEFVRFPFTKGQVGDENFWVKKVEHIIEDNRVEIMVWLDGGFCNKYRQFVLDKALFHGEIGLGDVYHLYSFELDKRLKEYSSDNQNNIVYSQNSRRRFY